MSTPSVLSLLLCLGMWLFGLGPLLPLQPARAQGPLSQRSPPASTPITLNGPYPVTPGYHRVDLPDSGPRIKTPITGQGAEEFKKALNAYHQQAFVLAGESFREFIRQFPDSGLLSAARAFLADTIVRQSRNSPAILDALELYRSIILHDPHSPNGFRARWRLGDLYAAADMNLEARSNYERGLADSPEPGDRNRALLGLGTLSMSSERWKEGEQAFSSLRKHTTDEAFLTYATLGLADSLYMQRRFSEAVPLYVAGMDRWPTFTRMRPRTLLAYGDTLLTVRHNHAGREIFTLFSNLYPKEPETAAVLVRLGDSYREANQRPTAALFFVRAIVGRWLADSLYMQRRFSEAVPLYVAGMDRWPTFTRMRPRTLLAYGDTLLTVRHNHAGREIFTLFSNLYPKEPETAAVLVRLGDSYREANQRPTAALFFVRAITQYPRTPYAGYGNMRLAELGDQIVRDGGGQIPTWVRDLNVRNTYGPIVVPDHIRHMYQTLSEQYAGTALGSEALFHLGQFLERAGNRSDAVLAYQTLIAQAKPSAANPWPSRGVQHLAPILRPWIESALQAHDTWGSIMLLYRLGPKAADAYADTQLLLTLADAHRALQFSDRAVTLYQHLLRGGQPRLAQEALMGLGKGYLDQRDFQAATHVFERYRILYPLGKYTEEAMRHLAIALEGEGNAKRVIQTSQAWMKKYPSHAAGPDMWIRLGKAFRQTGNARKALTLYRKADAAGGITTVTAHIEYGNVLVMGRRYREAVQWYTRALKAASTSTEQEWARLGLTRALLARKHYGSAKKEMTHLLENADPGDLELPQYVQALRGEIARGTR